MDARKLVDHNYGVWVKQYSEAWKKQIDQLREKFGNTIEDVLFPVQDPTDIPVVFVNKNQIIEVLKYLKETPGFEYNFLTDYTASERAA